jgi:hypothetical protein
MAAAKVHEFYSEIYLLADEVTAEQWQKFYLAVLQYCGVFHKFEIIFACQGNVVRYFVGSDQDLSVLSNNIEGFVLRPVDKSELHQPESVKKERFIQWVSNGNFLDLKEKYLVKRGLDLELVRISVRTINVEKAIIRANLYFKNKAGQYVKSSKTMTFFPKRLLAVDFADNSRYLKKSAPKYLDIEKSLHMLQPSSDGALFEVETFPYFSKPFYLNAFSYEFDKHSFIIGATGSGKSKFISLYVDRLYKTAMRQNLRIVIIDPHASLQADLAHLENTKIVNFTSESAELFSDAATDLTAATELTATLFSSLLGDQFNPRLDRTLRFSLFVLFTAQTMSLETLKRFLTDIDYRNQLLQHVNGYVPQNILTFFGADFNDMRTKYYNEAISPVVSLVEEMQLQPALVKGGDVSLAATIQSHFLTVFSLNKVSMGERTVKTVAGLLIQQIFLLAQARAFGQKLILIVDEVSVVQNPTLASILAEARKFNLTVILTQQYFGQIEKPLQDAIFANVYNYYVFRVSEEDARALEGNLNIELPKPIIDEAHAKGLKEADVRVKIMTELNPRECLLRLSAKGQINPAIKARTVDAPVPKERSHEEIVLETVEKADLPTKFVESVGGPELASLGTAPQSAQIPPTTPTEPTIPEVQSVIPQPTMQQQNPQTPDPTELSAYAPTQASQPDLNTGRLSLSELLAKHSSSRINLRERKK